MAPEGLYFKCTFTWQSSEGGHEDRCYLWIYATDEGTTAGFDFGIYLTDGWNPLYLKTHTGSHYEFATSDLFQGVATLPCRCERLRTLRGSVDTA